MHAAEAHQPNVQPRMLHVPQRPHVIERPRFSRRIQARVAAMTAYELPVRSMEPQSGASRASRERAEAEPS